ncbi:MAG: MFS transporter [Deltaproteobacteria bacterium]|nr:MFS transporter [Deltaproteobacteria bacterium]
MNARKSTTDIFSTLALDRAACTAALIVGGLVTLFIAIGSQWLRHFDWMLLHYAIASVFAFAASTYRIVLWLRRPPTQRYWQQNWRLFRAGGIKNSLQIGKLLFNSVGAQKFIAQRSRYRWIMHLCLSWGGMLAFALTFPLVFGWVHFETPADDLNKYHVVFFGMKVQEFSIHSLIGFITFNMLNIAAVIMLVGVLMALYRRLTDGGAIALQRFSNDIAPLLLLLVVAASGLGLTISAHFMNGRGFPFIAATHAASVIILLLSLPFGKLFHIFQRPAHIGVGLYKHAGQMGAQAHCGRCGEAFASQMHVDDLKQVFAELGMDAQLDGPVSHYQEVCPPCRRRLLALNQGKTMTAVKMQWVGIEAALNGRNGEWENGRENREELLSPIPPLTHSPIRSATDSHVDTPAA